MKACLEKLADICTPVLPMCTHFRIPVRKGLSKEVKVAGSTKISVTVDFPVIMNSVPSNAGVCLNFTFSVIMTVTVKINNECNA